MSEAVLIIGAGPTGLTAALELSRLGIPVRIIDKQAAPTTTSRALGVQARTLELLEQRGLASALIRLGNPGRGASIYGGGKRVARLDFSQIHSRFNYVLLVSQVHTERLLRRAIEREGVDVEHGVELVGIAQEAMAQDADPVTATLRHEDGRLELVHCPWLISAEGAHSTVRATLNLPFVGKTLSQQFALGDLHVASEVAESDLHIFASEHGFMALFPLGQGMFRLVADDPTRRAAMDTPPTLGQLQATYDERSQIAARLHDLTWSSWFHINSRMVRRLRIGRLLLGGDAAHIHSPAAAQGMNTGIQDMINLAWKLALVIEGHAQPAMLDTYAEERLPVMRSVLSETETLTDLMASENPIVRSLFNHLGPWIGAAGLFQENATARISQIAINYRGSSLSANHAHGGGLHAGDRVPDVLVRAHAAASTGWRERRLLGLLDPSRFTLLLAHGEPAAAHLIGAIQPWQHLFSVVEMAPGAGHAARSSFQSEFGLSGSVFVVRPDGYVGLAAGQHAAPQHLDAYCRKWLNAAAPAEVEHAMPSGVASQA